MSDMIPGSRWQETELEYAVKGTSARLIEAEAARDRLANQLLNEVPDSYIQMKARALDAEAAIQRVRELCESAITDYHRQAAKNGVARAEMARRILRALDGDA